MYYEINVSLKEKEIDGYCHLFATSPRSATSLYKVKRILKVFIKQFPKPKYHITITRYDERGVGEDINELLNK